MGRIDRFVGALALMLLASPALEVSNNGRPVSRADDRVEILGRGNTVSVMDLGGGFNGLAFSQQYKWSQISPWSNGEMGGTTAPNLYLYPRGLTYDMVRSTTSEIGGGQLIFGLCDPIADFAHCAPNAEGAPTATQAFMLVHDTGSVFVNLIDTVSGMAGIGAERNLSAFTVDGATWAAAVVAAYEDGRSGFLVQGSNGGHLEADYIQADRQLVIAPKPLSWFQNPANAPTTDGIQIPCKRGVDGGCTVDAVVISTPTPTAATGYSWASLCTPNKAPQ